MSYNKDQPIIPIVKRKKKAPLEIRGIITDRDGSAAAKLRKHSVLKTKHHIYIGLYGLCSMLGYGVILRLFSLSSEAFLAGMISVVVGAIIYPYVGDYFFIKLFSRNNDGFEVCYRIDKGKFFEITDKYIGQLNCDIIDSFALNETSLFVSFGDHGALIIPIHFFEQNDDINKWVLEIEKWIGNPPEI